MQITMKMGMKEILIYLEGLILRGTMFKSDIKIVALVYLVNLLLCISLPLLGLVELTSVGLITSLGIFFLMNILGVVITFHRFLTHRAFKFKYKVIEWIFTIFGVISCTGSPLGWVGIHSDHHKYSDTDLDPHRGASGFLNLQALRYNKKSRFLSSVGEGTKNKWMVRHLVTSKFHLIINQFYFLFIIGYVGILAAAFGLTGIYYGFILPSAITLFAENLTNWAAHQEHLGYFRHNVKDVSRNIWWLNIFSWGDGWHNNHHNNPSSITTKEKWWEFDPAGFIIKMVKE